MALVFKSKSVETSFHASFCAIVGIAIMDKQSKMIKNAGLKIDLRCFMVGLI